MIRKAELKDINGIVKVHKLAFSSHHFTSFFSRKLLQIYYGYFLNEPNQTFILKENEDTVGFIVIGSEIPRELSKFKQENLSLILQTAFLNPLAAIRKLVLDIYIRFFDKSNDFKECSFLLLSIATLPDTKGKGAELMKFIDEFMMKNSIQSIGLYVRVQNIGAINFYLNHQYKIIGYSNAQYYMEKTVII